MSDKKLKETIEWVFRHFISEWADFVSEDGGLFELKVKLWTEFLKPFEPSTISAAALSIIMHGRREYPMVRDMIRKCAMIELGCDHVDPALASWQRITLFYKDKTDKIELSAFERTVLSFCPGSLSDANRGTPSGLGMYMDTYMEIYNKQLDEMIDKKYMHPHVKSAMQKFRGSEKDS